MSASTHSRLMQIEANGEDWIAWWDSWRKFFTGENLRLEPITSQTSVAWAIWWDPGVVRHSEIGRYSVKMNDANQAKVPWPSILTGETLCSGSAHVCSVR
jgi:hypothetical protein